EYAAWRLCCVLLCCTGQRMESIPSSSVVKKPGETLSLSCRGSGFTFTSYGMHWIRQPAGKGLEWIGSGFNNPSSNTYASGLSGRIEVRKDNTSSKTVTLNGQNMQPEDSAVYYCARQDTVTQTSSRAVQKPLTPELML
uniref:Ig-like domain-containing protein n=1 Tax=Xiphophorus maculatus TaxID=8083 RepID=A0A3B5Q1R0_XIPMA